MHPYSKTEIKPVVLDQGQFWLPGSIWQCPKIFCIIITITPKRVGFPSGSVLKNPSSSAGDTGNTSHIPESGRSPGKGNGNPLQYSLP